MIRAETAGTSLKAAGEVISEDLLVAMTLKGLPTSYKTFATIVMQKETPMTFSEFKVALRNHEENERCCNISDDGNTDGVMSATNGTNTPNKFQGKCFKCGRKGHRSSDCYSKKVADKWCHRCKNNSHNTKDCRKGNSDAVKSATGIQEKNSKVTLVVIVLYLLLRIRKVEVRSFLIYFWILALQAILLMTSLNF